MEEAKTGKEKGGKGRIKSIEEFLADNLEVNPRFFVDLKNDNDWAFVIKAQALMESAITHAIVEQLGDKRIAGIVRKSTFLDPEIGKIAFVKALDILPAEMRAFVRYFGEVRNSFAHDPKSLDFRLKQWMKKMPKDKHDNLRNSMVAMFPESFRAWGKQTKAVSFVESMPRTAATLCVFLVVGTVHGKEMRRGGITEAIQWQAEFGSRTETLQPIPKGSK